MCKRKVMLLLMLLLFAWTGVKAQEKTVTGKVIDEDGQPIFGATISLKGSTVGTISGDEGKYTIKIPATIKGDTLIFSFIGMEEQRQAIGNRSTIDVIMKSSNIEVDEVVVTALGVSRKQKTLGYAASQVDADEISNANTTNVTNALAGRVAGVQVSSTSSNPGANSNIVIRGFSSINGSNQPLYIVDGIPLSNSSVSGEGINLSAGGLSNIASTDIESITILKGAAATALYGSRAANGVVVITTKNGKKGNGKNFSIEYQGTIQARMVSYLPDMQNDFGQGWNGKQTFIENGSWGPRFDGSTQLYGPIYNGQQLYHKYEALENNITDFLETGWSQNHNLAFNGVSEDNKMTYYLSYSYNSDNGIMPGTEDVYNRNSVAYRTTYKPTDFVKISSSINFARTKTKGVDSDQGVTAIDGLLELPRDVSLVDMKDLDNVFNTPLAYFTPYGITNPAWAIENTYFTLHSKEILGKIQADINPIKELTLTYRFSFDYRDYDFLIGIPKINNDVSLMWDDKGYSPTNMNQTGSIYDRFNRNYSLNHDILANYAKTFIDDKLDINVTAGLNVTENGGSNITSKADDLSINVDYWNLANGATKNTMTNTTNKRRLMGLLGDFTIGWDDMVYLGYSIRNDWSSTLPLDANSYLYQGATLSWIFTKLIPQNNILSFGKLRLAYGTTGNDASPYQTSDVFVQGYANAVYDYDVALFPMNGYNAYQKSTTASNAKLKPEMTREFEIGTNLSFFQGRVEVDASYYKRNSDDQIFDLPVDPATGYSRMIINFGEVENQGVELLLSTTPIKTKNLRWDLNFNFAKNNNKVISLPKELDGGKSELLHFAAGDDAVYMYAQEGKPLGELYTYLPTYDNDGNIIVTSDGLPLLSSEIKDTGKNIQADWTGGVTTSLSWKGLSFNAALDIRQGGWMISRTKNLMFFTGNGDATIYNDRNPFIIPNSVVEQKDADGNVSYVPNTTPLSITDSKIQDYFDKGGIYGGENYLVDRSYVKLRSLSLTYTLPKAWSDYLKLSAINVGVFCNNVFTWTAKTNRYIDPENTTYSQGSYGDLAIQFGELYSNPSCRVFGCNLGVKF